MPRSHRQTEEVLPLSPPAASDVKIGARVRHARLTRGLRLQDVAAEAGCSESLVSKVENDRLLPSLTMLHRLADVLHTTVGRLFAEPEDLARVVFRAGERQVVRIDPLRKGVGIELERLIPTREGHLLQGNIHIVAPGGGSEGAISHEGEEVGFVVEGRIELTVGEEVYLLEEEDSFCFRSDRPHGYRNPGPGRARIIFVNTPPSF